MLVEHRGCSQEAETCRLCYCARLGTSEAVCEGRHAALKFRQVMGAPVLLLLL